MNYFDAGFMPVELDGFNPFALPISRGVFQSAMDQPDLLSRLAEFQRGEFGGQDPQSAMLALNLQLIEQLNRAQTSSGVPVRENLEAEVKQLVPVQTPFRNRLRRVPGSSTASSWQQQTSLGGGYGASTTVTSGTSSATQTVGSTAGMQAGQSLYFRTTNAYRIISSITDGTTVVLAATISTTTAEVVEFGPYFQPGQSAVQAFFGESGAPADASPTYVKKTANYKLLGTLFSITNFAMAAGATFENQLLLEKNAAILRLMLMEENALINADSTNVTAPYGDGTNAYGFNGLLASITTANGTPVQQVQTAVGALTTSHIDAQLARITNEGAMDPYMLVNAQEAMSMAHLLEASGSIVRFAQAPVEGVLGKAISSYVNPVTRQLVPVLISRFVPAGTMVFGADKIADGRDAADVSVLPQVQLPQLAPNESIQGYVAQELAPVAASPHKFPGIVSVYEVFRMKSARVFAKSTGVTAV